MNTRRGFFRVWLLATGVWFACALAFTSAGEQAGYAARYYFDRGALEQQAQTDYERAITAYLNNPLRGTILGSILEPERPFVKAIPEPQTDWLLVLLLPPTLGVALLVAAIYLVGKTTRKTYHWLADGFKD